MTFGVILKRSMIIGAVVVLVGVSSTSRSAAQAGTSVPLPPCPDATLATPSATAPATVAAVTEKSPATVSPTPTPTLEPTPTQNPNAGYLGIAALGVQKCGARIEAIKQGSPAEDARLQVGDVVVAINGKPITGLADLRNAVLNAKKGDKLVLTIQRKLNQLDVTVTLGAIPANTAATLAPTAAATKAS